MTDNSLTTNSLTVKRTSSLAYSVFVLALIASAVYFFVSPTETVKAKNNKKAPASVLATSTFLTSAALPLNIPDNMPPPAGGIFLPIPVTTLPVGSSLRGVAVNIEFNSSSTAFARHTFASDIQISLIAPGGSPSFIVLDDGPFESSDAKGPYTFGDGTTGNWWTTGDITAGSDPIPAGGYRTSDFTEAITVMNPTFQGLVTPLTGQARGLKKLDQIPTSDLGNGTWMLQVSDDANQDTGNVLTASLTITTLAPTAATAEVRGRVITRTGQGIGRAYITIVNTTTLDSYVVMSNQFGHFTASELPVGDVYTMSVSHKQYQFPVATQAFTLSGDVGDAVFISEQ